MSIQLSSESGIHSFFNRGQPLVFNNLQGKKIRISQQLKVHAVQ